MRLTIDIDLEALPEPKGAELGRILRYWAGNVKHYPMEPGAGETISDSTYAPVGSWRFTE